MYDSYLDTCICKHNINVFVIHLHPVHWKADHQPVHWKAFRYFSTECAHGWHWGDGGEGGLQRGRLATITVQMDARVAL